MFPHFGLTSKELRVKYSVHTHILHVSGTMNFHFYLIFQRVSKFPFIYL